MKKHRSAMFNGESLYLEYEDCCFDDVRIGDYFSYLNDVYFKVGHRTAILSGMKKSKIIMNIIELDPLTSCKKLYKYIY